MTQTQTAPAKPAEASPAKPLFGFRALLADLAGWIRRHLLTVCLVLFVILINVGTQIVCALIRQPFPPSLAKVSFEALARGRWYTAPISMLYVPNLGRLLIDVPLMLVAFGLAESVIGKIKTAWCPSSPHWVAWPWAWDCAPYPTGAAPNGMRSRMMAPSLVR